MKKQKKSARSIFFVKKKVKKMNICKLENALIFRRCRLAGRSGRGHGHGSAPLTTTRLYVCALGGCDCALRIWAAVLRIWAIVLRIWATVTVTVTTAAAFTAHLGLAPLFGPLRFVDTRHRPLGPAH